VTGGTAHAALTGKVAPLAKAAPAQTFGTKALTGLSSAWAQFTAGIKPLFQGIKGAFQGLIKGIKVLALLYCRRGRLQISRKDDLAPA
jgi:hypothetical protein